MYQRQLSKEGLQALVNNAAGGGAVGAAADGGGDDGAGSGGFGPNIQSAEDLRDLFTLRSNTLSDVRLFCFSSLPRPKLTEHLQDSFTPPSPTVCSARCCQPRHCSLRWLAHRAEQLSEIPGLPRAP